MDKGTKQLYAILALILIFGVVFSAAVFFTSNPFVWEQVKDYFKNDASIHATAVIEALISEPKLQGDGWIPVGDYGAMFDPNTGIYHYPKNPCIRQTIVVENDSPQFDNGTVLSGCISESNVFLTPTP